MIESKRYHIETRKEFERNLHVMQEQMRLGKVLFNERMPGVKRIEHSFKRARFLPNTRVDFVTINETVRSTANMVAINFNKQINDDDET